MDETIQTAPGFSDFGENVFDVFILADVAFIDHVAAQLFCKCGNAILETVSDVSKGQFSTFAPARFGYTECDGTVR